MDWSVIIMKNDAFKNKTFIVEIKNNQHNTWQGTIKWIEENTQESFRSALELIRLIKSTVKKEDDHS